MRGTRETPRRPVSLAARFFMGQLLLVAVVAAIVSAASYHRADQTAHEAAADRVLSMATTLANDPYVARSVQEPDPTAALQPFTETLVGTADVDFVTIMDRNGIRYTHPEEEQIGGRYVGTIDTAQSGRPLVEDFAGTLGPSVRAIVPVRGDGGSVVAMVSVGVTLQSLDVLQAAALPEILAVAAAAVVLGAVASYLLSRYLRRITLGYGPEELRRLFDYYDSALHSLREGLVLVDAGRRLVLYNDHAATLLGLPPGDRTERPVAELALAPSLAELFGSGRKAQDEVHLAGDRLLVVSQRPAGDAEEGARGTVATLRDHTEILSLSENLHGAQTLVTALRAQTHEHANHLHAIVSLLELGHTAEAIQLATRDLGDAQGLSDTSIGSVEEPFLAALLLGKSAQAQERGIELVVSGSGSLPQGALDANQLITVLGNLLDNAMDAVAGSADPRVWVDLLAADGDLVLTVADSGPGLPTLDLDALARLGSSTKPGADSGAGRGYGLALVRRTVADLGGRLEAENDGGAVFTVTVPLRKGAKGA